MVNALKKLSIEAYSLIVANKNILLGDMKKISTWKKDLILIIYLISLDYNKKICFVALIKKNYFFSK